MKNFLRFIYACSSEKDKYDHWTNEAVEEVIVEIMSNTVVILSGEGLRVLSERFEESKNVSMYEYSFP